MHALNKYQVLHGHNSCCSAAHLTPQVLPLAAVCRAGWLDARDAGAAHSTVMGVSNSLAEIDNDASTCRQKCPLEEGRIGHCTCVGMPWRRFFLVLVEKARLPASPAAGLPVYYTAQQCSGNLLRSVHRPCNCNGMQQVAFTGSEVLTGPYSSGPGCAADECRVEQV